MVFFPSRVRVPAHRVHGVRPDTDRQTRADFERVNAVDDEALAENVVNGTRRLLFTDFGDREMAQLRHEPDVFFGDTQRVQCPPCFQKI